MLSPSFSNCVASCVNCVGLSFSTESAINVSLMSHPCSGCGAIAFVSSFLFICLSLFPIFWPGFPACFECNAGGLVLSRTYEKAPGGDVRGPFRGLF